MMEFGLSLAAFAAFVATAIIVFRIFDVRNVMYALVATFGVVLTGAVVFAAIFLRNVDFWAFFALFLCSFLIFVQVFSIFYKSISLRLALDVHARQSGRATLEWIYTASILAGSFQRRLSGLEEAGLISRESDVIALTPKGRRMALRLLAVQKAFGIQNSG